MASQTDIIQHLTDKGWEVVGIMPVVQRLYPTIVGPKAAHIYIHENAERIRLAGDYQSEGRNILSTCWAKISPGANDSEAEGILSDFLAQVDRTIGESYAARLLRS
ncbi:MAG: hypothetical protein KJ558_10135 [Gammaproteobacteria bacterium]|nr:hypothetical protein [Gammaproteobacteria bacterium]MBU1655165.1 hypothetical protein [Gammaproteobacteria bacterium]MBU1959976.1 hypothetical protein [Gammaproteobacteria bacterium]